MKNSIKYFIFITSITFLFCLSIGFDLLPFLRGPAPYPPEWQWEYFFINTLSKIYAPIIFIILIAGLFWFQETKKIFSKKPLVLLCLLILLSFLFQMSILFFSRTGISVLIHRIINPDLNSYFTASLLIQNPIDFLKNYEDIMKQFVYHARSHPPGAIFLFYAIKQLVIPFTSFISFANHLTPTHADVRQVWDTLLPVDRATAVFSAFFLPLLSSMTLIPIFKTAKRLYGEKVAIRSTFFYIFIPSIVFFIPINDVFLPLFSVGAFYFLLKGLQDKSSISFFFSGFILFLGVTFNLALLPLILFFFLFALFFIKKNNLRIIKFVKEGLLFTVGFFLPPILLYLFLDFNFIKLIQMIFEEVPHVHSRSYTTWLFYNELDFFIFIGIPLTIIFFIELKQFFSFLVKKQWTKIDMILPSFLIMFVILDLTGSTRGETGRIWSIFMPFVLIPAVAYLSNSLKFSSKLFVGLLLLQALQILVMQEFWVMLW